jgi:AcrR family transcriptional regulator
MTEDTTLSTARARIIDAAISLLAESGPSEVKARSVAVKAGVSTMGVYTHFGGVPELLQAVADEGFKRQAAFFRRAPRSDDPMANLYTLALVCRDFAEKNRHLYDLMFGLSIDGRYNNSRGAATPVAKTKSVEFERSFAYPLQECIRLVETDCVRQRAPMMIAVQFWSGLHGFIMLELGGHFDDLADPTTEVLEPLCINMIVGMGAEREKAVASAEKATTAWADYVAASGRDVSTWDELGASGS